MNKAIIERLNAIRERRSELEHLLASEDVIKSSGKAKSLGSEYRGAQQVMELYDQYRDCNLKITSTLELANDDSEPELAELAREEVATLKDQLKTLEENIQIALLPKDSSESADAIMEIRAGTGGDEAGIFAADLQRMYYRYAEIQHWKVEQIHSVETGIGSLKETIFRVAGDKAYTKLSMESGVHRVQRVPVTESQGRVHTSTATVAVLPKVEETDLEIDESDIKMDIFHASGHGGQNVNKVATAVRLTHLPTNLVVVCQNERSQIQNRRQAMEVLRARLWERKIRAEQADRAMQRRLQIGSGERSEKIRTYNYPQNRITDHRINLTSHDLQNVLDGKLAQIIQTLLAARQTELLATIK